MSRGELATGGWTHLKRADCHWTARFIIEVSFGTLTGSGGWVKLKRHGGSLNHPKGKQEDGGRNDKMIMSRVAHATLFAYTN